METIVLTVIGLVIIYQGYKIVQKQKELKRKMFHMKEDFNIEFRNNGSISKQRKNYEQMTDDWRQVVGSEEPYIKKENK